MDQRAYLLALVSLDLDEALVISTVTLREGRRTGQPTRETRCIEGPCQHGEDTVDFGLSPSKIRGERKWPRSRSKPACLASLESANPGGRKTTVELIFWERRRKLDCRFAPIL
jgi:hypothetical protein